MTSPKGANVKKSKMITRIEELAIWLGVEPRCYSGRFMFGAECVGVVAKYDILMKAIKQYKLPEAKVDSMGFDHIAYWPEISWSEWQSRGKPQSEQNKGAV